MLTNISSFEQVKAVSDIRKEFPTHMHWSLFGIAPGRAQKLEMASGVTHS